MIGSERLAVWLRGATLPAGMLAALAMIVVGCQAVTNGSATIERADAPLYRASMSASSENAAISSSARESERLATSSKQALHTSCEALSSSSVDAIDAVNAYVRAYNAQGSDAAAKAGPAVDALNKSADLVTASLSDALAPELTGALNDWVAAARDLASIIGNDSRMGDFNTATGKLNDVKQHALKLCDAAY